MLRSGKIAARTEAELRDSGLEPSVERIWKRGRVV
ncbi:conserved protein of unknown function [Ectopseudomonas oleovorans]|uniref:Uncharacterized protein n=1 Tax=Ectopseudomonas oleovorans TaxID=301 RepID=A0A653BBN7_ECTOL|nr:conserved protein of unknown function [Pseudomonas oleovorans]